MIVVHVEFPKRPLSLSLLVSINNRHPRRRIMRSRGGVLLSLSARRFDRWSPMTSSFIPCRVCIPDKLIGIQPNALLRICAGETPRSIRCVHYYSALEGGVVIGIGSPGWLPPFTHTRKIREPAVRNGQTTVTQYYSLLASCSSTRGTSRCSGGEIDGSTLRIYRSRGRVTRV